MAHHAFVIAAEPEQGIETASAYLAHELRMKTAQNPDVLVLRYGLFSTDDAREVMGFALQKPVAGAEKALIISTTRLYHEAQNALLKLFEEPPHGTYLFLIVPSLGMLLPTLRSRVQVLGAPETKAAAIAEIAQEFLKSSKEKRSTLIKKLATGKDEDERRENRDQAIQILSGIEAMIFAEKVRDAATVTLLQEIAELRGYLYERSAPVRMILEHVALVLPKGLK